MAPFIPYPMLLRPVFSERPWGGDRLRTLLGKDAAPDKRIGESWELSDHPNGRSSIANGPYAGKLFGDLIREHPQGMCGVTEPPLPFPLLVKYIDSADALSIQVHPNDEQARRKGERGKNECWYIMDCPPGAYVLCGVKPGVTREQFEIAARAQDGSIEPLVRRQPIRPGSFVYMPAGTVHAIMGGTLLCEIQQCSDLTYRLWDWGRRVGKDLHIEDALGVTNYNQPDGIEGSPLVLETCDAEDEVNLARNEYFDVRLRAWPGGRERARWEFENTNGTILNVVQGAGSWKLARPSAESGRSPTGDFQLGETWYLPTGLQTLAIDGRIAGVTLLVSQSREIG